MDQVTAKNRTQWITPGQYLLFCVLNCFTSPTSTNQLQDWFDTTLLTELYPEAQQFLTPQNIWNNFKYLNDAHLQEIFFQLTQKVLQTQGDSLNTILFDSTNFYTYIDDHPQNSIPKKGHSKDKKDNLNLVNFCLLIDEEKEFPVYYQTYPGNVPDSKYFQDILPEISKWFQRLAPDHPAPDITFVFDKGNNSTDALKIVEQNKWGFIGSLRPSMFQELLQEPYTEFSKIYDTKKKHAVYAFRRMAKIYTDELQVIIVTFDEQVCNKKLHTLENQLAKKFDELQDFTIVQLNSKPQWKDPAKIQKHVETQILESKEFKTMIHIVIEAIEKEAIQYQELRWGLNSSKYLETVNTFGKSIIFTNHLDWSTKDIVLGYRQQFKLEKKFSDMKSTDYIQVRPIFTWTDANIQIHIFICLLALLGQALLKLKLKDLKIQESFLTVCHALENVHKINLFYGNGTNKNSIPPKLNKTQEKLVTKLQLTQFL